MATKTTKTNYDHAISAVVARYGSVTVSDGGRVVVSDGQCIRVDVQSLGTTARERITLASAKAIVSGKGVGVAVELDHAAYVGQLDAAKGEFVASVAVADLVSVGVAASRDQRRPALTGMLVERIGRELVIVATDSYRLHWVRDAVGGVTALPDCKALVPAAMVATIAKLAKVAKQDRVSLYRDRRSVECVVGEFVVTALLIDADFPNWRQLLPDHPHAVDFGELSWPSGVRVMVDENGNVSTWTDGANANVNRVHIADIGSMAIWAPNCKMLFGGEYLADAIKHAGSVGKAVDHLKPMVLGDVTGRGALVMPVRLS